MGFEDGVGPDPLDETRQEDNDVSVRDQILRLGRELAGLQKRTERALGAGALDSTKLTPPPLE